MKRAIAPFGGGGVRLRLLTDADLEMTRRWRNQDNVRIWFKSTEIVTIEQHRAWFEKYSERDDDFLFVVEASGQPVGQASVYGIDWESGTAEVGRFVAAPEARGRGYIGTACAELIGFSEETLGLRSLFLDVKEDNERAIAIYLRSGFREEERSGGMIRMRRILPASVEACGQRAGDAR